MARGLILLLLYRKESTPIILYDDGLALKISYASAATSNNYRHLVAEFAATVIIIIQ